jgi:ABC-type iron transport system FetAB ATPase subunit
MPTTARRRALLAPSEPGKQTLQETLYKGIHADTGDVSHETAETRPSELATLRARVQKLEMRESAHLTEIASLQAKVTLLTDKQEKWQRVWDARIDTREVMMTEASEVGDEQRQLREQIHEDLGGVATVLNTIADLQLALTLRHRAMMDIVTGLASDSASRDLVLTE